MAERISFRDQITRNKIKSFILIGVIVIAFLLGPGYFFIIMIFSIIFSLSYVLISYYKSDKIALASVKAKPASKINHREFFNAAENMSLASGLPMPRLYVMESSEINAFASGRDPQNAVICVTTGCLKELNKQELEGVIAHEMSHIANYDIRFMTLTAILVGLISIVAQIFLRSLWFSSLTGGSGGRGKDGRMQIILIVLGIFLAILAPLFANLVSLAISRKREFTADATAVKFTRYPPGLASALKKIRHQHVSEKEKHRYAKALAPLFISDPFKRKIKGMFSTHPDVNERISKLERM
ncbi:zinc metalloprotease HtpX [Candidatus Parvarchaeota archaeon]|nr:MAG: zinc metalloprotease HtpX [Candidatus Parvarchaeota archaeon]